MGRLVIRRVSRLRRSYPLMPIHFTVKTGHTYTAKVDWPDSNTAINNDIIIEQMTNVGFSNVVVTGTDANNIRYATGIWLSPNTALDMPEVSFYVEEWHHN